jgi:hypothetical protein
VTTYVQSIVQKYIRRQALEEELERTGAPSDPRLDKVDEVLSNFGRFWELETEPADRRKLLATTPRHALRPRLARRRHDRRRQAQGTLSTLLPNGRRTGSSPRTEVRCH